MGSIYIICIFELRCKKTGLRGFRPGPTQTGLYSRRRWLEALNFRFRKWRDFSLRVAKTKSLISFAVTAKLICVFVFAYAKSRFSHNEAHLILQWITKFNTWLYYYQTQLHIIKNVITLSFLAAKPKYSFLRKLDFGICKNKCADQLGSNCAADPCLCFSYIDNTIPLLPKSEISRL